MIGALNPAMVFEMKQTIYVARTINSTSDQIFPIIADYNTGHLEILPKPPFLWLKVLEGGYGQGTKIQFAMKVWGRTQVAKAVISEPTPGKILREEMESDGIVTTYHLEPQGASTVVAITTEMNFKGGWVGRVQHWFTRKFLEPVYAQELKNLDDVLMKRSRG